MVQITQLIISLDIMIIMYNIKSIRPLWINLPRIIGFVKYFESNKTVSFKINDNKLLKEYNEIWKKAKNLLNIKFDSESYKIHKEKNKNML